MKWAILLILLVSCAPAMQETTTKPVMSEELEPQPLVEDVPETVKEPAKPEIKHAEEPPQPKLSPKEKCLNDCEQSCENSAHLSCTQTERSKCKSLCGEVIDPSACSQACTYINQPNQCKRMFNEFCTAQCIGICT